MTARDHRAAFARGIRQFNSLEFWHSHESWEAIWLTAPEPEKTFLQGIIQIAAGFYHHQTHNREGMRSLLRRGLAKMEQFPAGYCGLRLEELRRAVRNWLDADARGEALPRRYPRLRRAGRRERTLTRSAH
jgi:predicted metal-dependent hydrolase